MHKDEPGRCEVCGRDSIFRFDPTIITPQLKETWGISERLVEAFNRKESMFCSSCGCSLRIRRLASVLTRTFSEMRGRSYDSLVELLRDREFLQLKIAEINTCGALHSYLKIHPNLYYSEWFNGIKSGEMCDGIRCEDIQRLSYPDSSFDIILTSETLEHVPDPHKAWREICRTLKVGGYHIFTIPAVPSQASTVMRAKLVDGKRHYLLAPAYHGNGTDESMFVYTDFGMDVVEELDGMGLKTQIFFENPQDDFDVALVFRSLKLIESLSGKFEGESDMLEWTGERYVPWIEEATIGYEHLHRYAYAAQFVTNKKVLDLASGEGYGSRLLAQAAESVVGVDIDEQAIKHARNKYIRNNLKFAKGSITDIPIEGRNIFDVIVCFEAIEHIDDHEKLLKEVTRLLTRNGLFIVSTPNKTAYSDEPKYENPFHVHELYFDEFTALLEKHFTNVKVLGQRIYCNSNIWPIFSAGISALTEYVIERNPKEFVFVERDKRIPMYFIAIASQVELNENASNLVDISNELLKQKDIEIGNLAAARDTLEGSISAQQQALMDKEQNVAQLTAERERLTQELGQQWVTTQEQQQALVAKEQNVAQLTAERERLTQELGQQWVTTQEQQQALVAKEQNVAQLTAERERLTQELGQQWVTIQKQQQALVAKEQNVTQLTAERERLTGQVGHLQNTAQSQQRLLAEKEVERHRFSQESSQIFSRLQAREVYIQSIEDSLAWQLLTRYRRLRDKLCPEGTGRGQVYNSIKNRVKRLVSARAPTPETKHEQLLTSNPPSEKLTSIVRTFSGRPVWARHPRQIPAAVSLALSGLFEPSWYFQKNKDVAESGMSAIFHYLLYGAKEGRDPNPYFDTSWYLKQNPDVPSAGINPLVHYVRHGAREGRDPSPSFDTSYYLEQNPDVMRAGMNPLAHYLTHGIAEGRVPRRPEVKRDAGLNAEFFPALPKWWGLEPNLAEYVTLRPPPPGPPWVLVVADRVPTPDMTSGSVRLSAILQLMHELGLRISFISALRKEEYRFVLEPGSELGEYEERLRSLDIGEVNYGWDDAIQELKQNGWRYRFAFLSFAEFTYRYLPLVRASGIHAKIIYDTVDLHALRLKREAEVNGNQELVEKGAYYQKIELCNIQCTDAVIAISDEEATRIREMAPQARVATIPNIHTAAPGKASMQTRQDLLFIGHYLHTPNVDAVTFFVREILPRVRKVLPKVTIRLVGSNMPEAVRALKQPGVLPIGYAKDVRPYFDSSRIFVAPLRYGAGMKGKIGHAMSWGLPVVTTSIGAEGMDLISGDHALIADSPDAFADAVIRLYNDQKLWEQISQAAAQHMRDRFSAETVRPTLAELFTENFYADNDVDGNRD